MRASAARRAPTTECSSPTATACWARSRTPRTPSRRPFYARGAGWPVRGPKLARYLALPDRDQRVPDAIERRPSASFRSTTAPRQLTEGDPGEPLVESVWVEPYPDERLELEDGYAAPAARYEQREAVELAFVAALQHLPARQRAVLILREVLGFSAREVVAETLDTTVASVNSALQRALKAVDERLPGAGQQAPCASSATSRPARSWNATSTRGGGATSTPARAPGRGRRVLDASLGSMVARSRDDRRLRGARAVCGVRAFPALASGTARRSPTTAWGRPSRYVPAAIDVLRCSPRGRADHRDHRVRLAQDLSALRSAGPAPACCGSVAFRSCEHRALEGRPPRVDRAGRPPALACVYAMDLTVLHLAVPQLSEDLQPTSAQLLWIADIYGFMVAGALITMGTLGDRIGRRRCS